MLHTKWSRFRVSGVGRVQGVGCKVQGVERERGREGERERGREGVLGLGLGLGAGFGSGTCCHIWKRGFKLPWREAGTPKTSVDPDQ